MVLPCYPALAETLVKLQAVCDALYVNVYDDVCMDVCIYVFSIPEIISWESTGQTCMEGVLCEHVYMCSLLRVVGLPATANVCP